MNKDRVIIEIVGKKTRLQRFILIYMFIEYSWLAVTRLGRVMSYCNHRIISSNEDIYCRTKCFFEVRYL